MISLVRLRTAAVAALCGAYVISALPLKQHIATPAYWLPCDTGYNNCDWDRLDGSSPTAGLAVMNPASGPGPSLNPDYVAQRARSASANVTVIGYVATARGNRSIADVQTEIAAYFNWYTVDGIFVDEASDDCANADYYGLLAAFVRSFRRGGGSSDDDDPSGDGKPVIVLNPGGNTQQCYLNATDIIVGFEGPYEAYSNGSYEPATWMLDPSVIDPSRVWHIVYEAAGSDASPGLLIPAADAVNRAKAWNAGWVYVTNATLPNPYAALPPVLYFDDIIRWAANVI